MAGYVVAEYLIVDFLRNVYDTQLVPKTFSLNSANIYIIIKDEECKQRITCNKMKHPCDNYHFLR